MSTHLIDVTPPAEHMTPADIAIVRDLLIAARAQDWQHLVYGGSFGREHVWRLRGAQISLSDGMLEVQADGERLVCSASSAARVRAALDVAFGGVL